MIHPSLDTDAMVSNAQHHDRDLPCRWTAAVLAVVVSVACGGDSPEVEFRPETPAATGDRPWADEDSWWNLALEAESEPDLYLTRIRSVDVDSGGQVFLADGSEGGITVLTPDLKYLGTVGRAGEGPGEFESRQVQILPGDTLLVYDSALGRLTFFDPEDLEVASTSRPPDLARGPVSLLWKLPGQGRYFALDRLPYVAGESEAADEVRRDALIALDESSDPVSDTLLFVPAAERLVARQPGMLMVGGHPFGRESLVGILGGDRLVHANSRAFEITILDFEGTTTHAISHPTPPLPVTSAEMQAELEDRTGPLGNVLRSGAPYTWPALAGLVTDDQDRIWVGVRGAQGNSDREWAAFRPDGEHLGSVHLPAGHLLQAVRDNRLYVVSHDEFDVPSLQAYRIQAQVG